MREVVLDTETTGLDPGAGHRVVEIGCVELVNHLPTGVTYHSYLNPDRPMPSDAFEIHGLSDAFLADKPRFHEVVDELLAFLGGSPLVIHNAAFDLGFMNAELLALNRPPLGRERAVDTVQLAREKFPGAPASLDALCKRFVIDASARKKHGALLDAELLAEVYLELIGGRQPDLTLDAAETALAQSAGPVTPRSARAHAPTPDEVAAHRAFVESELKQPIWLSE